MGHDFIAPVFFFIFFFFFFFYFVFFFCIFFFFFLQVKPTLPEEMRIFDFFFFFFFRMLFLFYACSPTPEMKQIIAITHAHPVIDMTGQRPPRRSNRIHPKKDRTRNIGVSKTSPILPPRWPNSLRPAENF